MQGEKRPIDEQSKKLLGNFKVTPPSHNWDNISEALHGKQLDLLFQTHLSNPTTPAEKNWKAIRQHLPLRVIYRRQLIVFSRIAAIIAIALIIPSLLIKAPFQKVSTSPPITSIEILTTIGEAVEQADKIQQEEKRKPVQYKNTVKKPKPTEAELLLASLLADENEFPDSLLDLEKLKAILQPLEPLPIVSATARIETLPLDKIKLRSNRKRSPQLDFQISIPLIIVEQEEIEELIEIYDQKR